MPGDSTDSRGHRAARLLWLREQEPGEENAPQRTGAPQPLGGGLPRCCHGTRHQHNQRLTSSDTQCTSCRDKGLQTCGRRQHKGVFSGAGAQKPEIKAVPSGGPEASLPAPGGSWRLTVGRGITASSASITTPPFHLSSPLFFPYQDICGTSLVVQGLSLNAEGPGSIPGRETGPHMSQLETQLLLLLLPSRFGRLLMSQSAGSGCTAQCSQHTRSLLAACQL